MSCPWVAADLRLCVGRAEDLDGLSGESRFIAHLVAQDGHATRAEAKRLAAIADRLRASAPGIVGGRQPGPVSGGTPWALGG
jgi:hypothetical protein